MRPLSQNVGLTGLQQAKKKLQKVGRALRNVNATPRTGIRKRPIEPSPFEGGPIYSYLKNQKQQGQVQERGDGDRGNDAAAKRTISFTPQGPGVNDKPTETEPLNIARSRTRGSTGSGMRRYGSIIGSPPTDTTQPSDRGRGPPSLHLPDPALHPAEGNTTQTQDMAPAPTYQDFQPRSAPNAFTIGKQHTPSPLQARHQSLFPPKRLHSTPGAPGPKPFMKRVMSLGGNRSGSTPPPHSPDVELAAYREFDMRQAEFFHFLDSELGKIDAFYREKENEATERLKVLREQLHIMRDRRLEDLIKSRKSVANAHRPADANGDYDEATDPLDAAEPNRYVAPWQKAVANVKQIAGGGRVGKATKAMEGLATPSNANVAIDSHRDYTRRKSKADIPYRTAKRKLKNAMQEYYRGLELLKSYALLNRTGFRKINKKYDKTVSARPAYKYLSEKVNKAWFVQSDVVDDHIRTVEDLYARYFEQGNHKIAATKLRNKISSAGDYTGSVFRTGCLIAAGLVFGIQGLVYGSELLFSNDPTLATNTSFLLQVSGFAHSQI